MGFPRGFVGKRLEINLNYRKQCLQEVPHEIEAGKISLCRSIYINWISMLFDLIEKVSQNVEKNDFIKGKDNWE